MVKKYTTGKTEQIYRHTEQINVYTYLVMSILFCTFVVEIRYKHFKSKLTSHQDKTGKNYYGYRNVQTIK